LASPTETAPGNHGEVISTLVHDIQSAPVPEGDSHLGQAIGDLLPAVQFGPLIDEFIHEVAPGPCRFGPSEVAPGPCTPPGEVFSAFVHDLLVRVARSVPGPRRAIARPRHA